MSFMLFVFMNWRLRRLLEKTDGLKAKIEYFESLNSGVAYVHDRLVEWKYQRAVLLCRQEFLSMRLKAMMFAQNQEAK